jgi:hypothetical protein
MRAANSSRSRGNTANPVTGRRTPDQDHKQRSPRINPEFDAARTQYRPIFSRRVKHRSGQFGQFCKTLSQSTFRIIMIASLPNFRRTAIDKIKMTNTFSGAGDQTSAETTVKNFVLSPVTRCQHCRILTSRVKVEISSTSAT